MKVREACARVLAQVLRGEGSLNTLLPLYSAKIPPRDASLLQELCFGTLRHYPALQVVLETLLDTPLKAKDADITAVLLAALYQIRELRTPSHAAVNESVAASGDLKKHWARGLINGVLRRYLREREAIDATCGEDSRYQHLHPQWLVDLLRQAWPDSYRQVLAANNQRPPMTLRVNGARTTRADYLDRLAGQGLAARPAPFAPWGIYLEAPCAVDLLPGFGDGLVSVQDEAAQLCAELLDLAPGQRVLDACCAPGGKTCHMLEVQPALAELVALDIDPQRLTRVEENLNRLGLKATLVAADASRVGDWWDGQPFDRILLDAPCSATGVIRRHPDIKVLRKATDIVKLAAIQLDLLRALWPTLAPGGQLLYATCSVLPAENDAVVSAFCNAEANCEIIPLVTKWGLPTTCGRQLLPGEGANDGFYYALLTKPAGDNRL